MGHQKLPRRPSNTRMKHHCSQSPTRVGRTLPCTCHCCWTAMPLQQQADAFVRAETSHTTHARMVELVLLLQSLTLPHSIKQTPPQLVPKKPPRTQANPQHTCLSVGAKRKSSTQQQLQSNCCALHPALCSAHAAAQPSSSSAPMLTLLPAYRQPNSGCAAAWTAEQYPVPSPQLCCCLGLGSLGLSGLGLGSSLGLGCLGLGSGLLLLCLGLGGLGLGGLLLSCSGSAGKQRQMTMSEEDRLVQHASLV